MGRHFAGWIRLSFLAASAAWGWTCLAASSGFFVLDLRTVSGDDCGTVVCRVAFSNSFGLDLRQLSDAEGEDVVQAASADFALDLREVTDQESGSTVAAFGNGFVLDLRNIVDEQPDAPEKETPACIEASSFAFVLDLTEVVEPETAFAASAGFVLDLRDIADQSAGASSAVAFASCAMFTLDLRNIADVAAGNSVVFVSSGAFELDLRKITVEGVIILPKDITGGKAIPISEDWVNKELDEKFGVGTGEKFGKLYGYDLKNALTKPTGKYDAKGNELSVWHDYVAGTDPTDPESVFQASVKMVDGVPVITWSPALNGEGVQEGKRTYRIFATNELGGEWVEVPPDETGSYSFFTVTVEMP